MYCYTSQYICMVFYNRVSMKVHICQIIAEINLFALLFRKFLLYDPILLTICDMFLLCLSQLYRPHLPHQRPYDEIHSFSSSCILHLYQAVCILTFSNRVILLFAAGFFLHNGSILNSTKTEAICNRLVI